MAQTNKEATARAELLALAIEHFCTTDQPDEEKLRVLTEAERHMGHVLEIAAKGRQEFAEYRTEATSI